MRFAENTKVSAEQSRSEIEKTLTRYGADAFAYGTDGNQAMVQFRMRSRMVKFLVPLPDAAEYRKSPAGRSRTDLQVKEAVAQAARQRWRALLLAIKAKLEVVESGIATFDQEFLPYLMLPNGQTVGDVTLPQLEIAYSTGRMPRALLPGLPEGA